MDNNDKLALRESTTAIKCKLIIKATDTLPQIILTESNCIKDWTYTDDRYVPQQGFIGQFVARTLSGNLQNIDDNFNIENREVELQIGIVNRDENTENWYSMGNFLITNPEDDEVRDNTKFEAMDYAKLFNKTFDGDYTDNIFTVSYNTKMENKETVNALWLAKYTCAQVNVELGSTVFTNSDYEIDINPFRNNEPCRDVMKEISKLAYSWVRIGWDNKCYIDFGVKQESSVDQYDIFTNDHYYTLETKKEVYGPINKVVVGMSNIDGESHAIADNPSITANGEHAIYIYDNPLTYTFEHRERANEQGNVLFGLTYSHIKCETIGFPWLIGNELISISNMEGNNKYTYPFNKTITYTGHIKSTIDSMGESAIEETLSYESDVVRNARNALINVNKQEGTIQILSERIENIPKEINPTGTASGSIIKLEDSSNNPLIDLEIEGKSEQEVTTQGVNLCPPLTDDKWVFNNGAYVDSSGNLQLPNSNSSAHVLIEWNQRANHFFIKYELVSGGNGHLVTEYLDENMTHLSGNGNAIIDKEDGYIHTLNFGGETTYGPKIAISKYIKIEFIRSSAHAVNPYTVNNVMVTVDRQTSNYLPFVPNSPSPDYPSEIESVGYENLFDGELELGRIDNSTGNTQTDNNSLRSKNFIPVNSNEKYTISNNKNYAQYIYEYDESYGFIKFTSNQSQNPFTFTTDDTTKYIKFRTVAGNVENDLTTLFIITKGTKVHSYIPYGKYGIEVETVGKNLWGDISWLTQSYLYFKLPKENTSYTLSIKLKPGKSVPNGLYLGFTENGRYDSLQRLYWLIDNGQIKTQQIKDNFYYKNNIYSSNNHFNYISVYPTSYANTLSDYFDIQLEYGDEFTGYQQYQYNTSLIVLNEPLRSLPNGTKDLLYIKNNHLYVDRYVSKIVLDGSEEWNTAGTSSTTARFYHNITNLKAAAGFNDRFTHISLLAASDTDEGFSCTTYSTYLYINILQNRLSETSTTGLKNWLALHNTEVTYELAEPYTEELGEIEIPSTYKGTTYIQTTDNLEPNLNITYVRDTVIGDYVENHVAELKITESEIKSSVERVSTSVNGLNTTVNRVEEITTDNSQVINVISTNINKTTGDVNAVTTKQKKFTFNDEGLKISAGENGFNSLQDETGTYYKDGTSVVGQYTKDGSKQKDLQLFGVYSYGMKDIDDTPMFIGQLYEDENGEECFGHFVNI